MWKDFRRKLKMHGRLVYTQKSFKATSANDTLIAVKIHKIFISFARTMMSVREPLQY